MSEIVAAARQLRPPGPADRLCRVERPFDRTARPFRSAARRNAGQSARRALRQRAGGRHAPCRARSRRGCKACSSVGDETRASQRQIRGTSLGRATFAVHDSSGTPLPRAVLHASGSVELSKCWHPRHAPAVQRTLAEVGIGCHARAGDCRAAIVGPEVRWHVHAHARRTARHGADEQTDHRQRSIAARLSAILPTCDDQARSTSVSHVASVRRPHKRLDLQTSASIRGLA